VSADSPAQLTAKETLPSAADWLTAFAPRRGLRNGHVQTIVGNFLPRGAFRLPFETDEVEVDPADGSRVLCHAHWHRGPEMSGRLTLVLVHGLEGSSDSRYIRGLTSRAWAAGCNVVRMNMRNCNGSDTLTPTLYHSGFSGDVGAVVERYTRRFGLERVALVGYSMGGNLVLKLAGEWGTRRPLCAVATVCPVIDLAAGSDALHELANRMYEWHFLRRLMRRFRRKAELFPHIYKNPRVGPVRSLREFDDKIVARYCGFRDADDYYYRVASARVIDRIALPTLILRALDDPFIRVTPKTREEILRNPNIRLIETPNGGHCAYLCGEPGDDIHWAESTVIRYLLQFAGQP
jgi:predicted alpha/beta-fold hydrolase